MSVCRAYWPYLPTKNFDVCKNQRPPADMAPVPSRGHPPIPAFLVVADLCTAPGKFAEQLLLRSNIAKCLCYCTAAAKLQSSCFNRTRWKQQQPVLINISI